MQETKQTKIGDSVMFINSLRQETPALVTAVWSPTCINVVIVSDDVNQTDTYGRQIQRYTSVMHKSCQGEVIYGMVWY
jgi:hypothetical protein